MRERDGDGERERGREGERKWNFTVMNRVNVLASEQWQRSAIPLSFCPDPLSFCPDPRTFCPVPLSFERDRGWKGEGVYVFACNFTVMKRANVLASERWQRSAIPLSFCPDPLSFSPDPLSFCPASICIFSAISLNFRQMKLTASNRRK